MYRLPSDSLRRRFQRIIFSVATVAGLRATFAATTLTWDSNGAGAGQTDGNGSWWTPSNWWNGSSNVTWNNGNLDTAVFGNGGAGGSVTLAAAVTAGGLSFPSLASGAYTITDINTLTLNAGAVISVANTLGTTMLDVPVAPSANGAGFSITGAGNVTFKKAVGLSTSGKQSPVVTMNGSGIVTFTGGTSTDNWGATVIVNSGTAVFAKNTDTNSHAVGGGATVAGGVLQLAGDHNDQFYDGAFLTINSGAFDMNARSETINNFTLAGVGVGALGAVGNAASGTSVLTTNGTTNIQNAAVVSAASGATLDLRFNGSVNGNGNILYKSGAGTVILSGSSDNVSVSATVASGTLVLGKASNSGVHAVGSPLVINAGAARLSGSGDDQIYDGTGINIDPGGLLETNGRSETVNWLSLAGTGDGAGVVRNSTGNSSVSVSGNATFAADASIGAAANASLALALNGSVSGDSHLLTKVGDGTVTLSGSGDNVSLWTSVSTGTLVLGKSSNSGVHAAAAVNSVASGSTLRLGGSGGDQLYNGTNNAGIDFGVLNMNGLFDLNGQSESLDKLTGSGTVTNSGGGVTLTLGINNGDGPAVPVFNGTIQGTGSGNGVIGMVKAGTGSQTLGGAYDNSSVNITVNGGTLILAKTSSSAVHAAAGIGGVSSGATLKLAGIGGDQIYDGFPGFDFGVFNMNGTLDLAGKSEGFDKLTGSGTVINSVGATQSTLTLGTNNSNGGATPTFNGVIQGNIAVTKTGSGRITLAGANAFAGATVVQAGTLSLSGASANNISLSPVVTVGSTPAEASAKLDVTGLTSGKIVLASGQVLAGHGSVVGNVEVASGATVSPGTSAGSFTISGGFSSNTSISTILIEVGGSPGNGGIDFDVLNVTGGLSIAGSQLIVTPLNNVQLNTEYRIIRAASYSASGNVFARLNGVLASNSFTLGNYSYSLRYQTGEGVYVSFSGVPEPATGAFISVLTPFVHPRRRRRLA